MSAAPRRAWAWLHRIEDLTLAVALALLVSLAIVQIGLRMVFDSGLLWLEPLLRLLVLWVAMLGAMVAAREGRHIGLDIAARALPAGPARWLRAVALMVAAGITALLAWHAGRMVLDERAFGGLTVAIVPVWVAQVILPVAFAVIAVRLALAALRPPVPVPTGEALEPTP